MELSHSRAATARGCWKKYYWKYIRNLEPIKQSNALTIGKVVHEAFELYYKGFSHDNCHAHIEDQFDLADSKAEAIEKEDLLISRHIALGMWDFYPKPDLNEFEEVSPEVEFSVRLGKSRTRLIGKIDGHVKKDGLKWVREFKTTGLNQKQFMGRMRTSSQATGYVYASYKMDFPVSGVMFDVIKKPLLRKKDSENALQFAKRIYEDYRWRPKDYFMRHYEYRSLEALALFEEDMSMLARDIRLHTNKGEFPRCSEQCWNFNSECPYMKICFSKKPDDLTIQLLYKEGSHGGSKGSEGGSDGEGTVA